MSEAGEGTPAPLKATIKRAPARVRFTPQERERALVAFAWAGGNSRRAAEDLANQEEDPIRVNRKTIWRWATEKYPAEYERVLAEEWPQIKALTAERHRAVGETAMTAELKGEAYREALAEGKIPPRDLAGSARNAAVSGGIHNQHSALLRGEPTERTEHRSSEEILRKLRALGAIEGEAEDVTDAQIVQSNQLPEVGDSAD